MSLITHLDTHPVLNALWNLDGLLDCFCNFARTVTRITLLDDLVTCAVTRTTD